jgi:hypothetical protein
MKWALTDVSTIKLLAPVFHLRSYLWWASGTVFECSSDAFVDIRAFSHGILTAIVMQVGQSFIGRQASNRQEVTYFQFSFLRPHPTSISFFSFAFLVNVLTMSLTC